MLEVTYKLTTTALNNIHIVTNLKRMYSATSFPGSSLFLRKEPGNEVVYSAVLV